jgi:hypothetical protein
MDISPRMNFRPILPHKYAAICLGIGLGLGVIGLGLARLLAGLPVSGWLFWLGLLTIVCFAAGVYFLYLAFAYFYLTYRLDRNGLQIRWGGVTQRVPIRCLTQIIPAGEVPLPAKQLHTLSLPDWWVGRWGQTHFYATTDAAHALVARTDTDDVVISPTDPEAFIRAWELRIPLGPTQTWSQEVVRWGVLNWPIWRDRLAWRLAGGAALVYAIVLGASLTAFPAWPDTIPLNLDSLGRTIISKEQVLWLPRIGGMILGLNLILGIVWHKKEPLAAYLLWSVTIVVQIGLWVAIRTIIN